MSDDLISRQAAMDVLHVAYLPPRTVSALQNLIRDLPSAVPKTARWVKVGPLFKGGYPWMRCSNCGKGVPDIRSAYYDYCPGCGAYMRGEQE